MATRLIELTLADASKVQVNVDSIIQVTPRGTGSTVTLGGNGFNAFSQAVTETPAAVKTLCNA